MEKFEIGDIVLFEDCPGYRFVVHKVREDGAVDLYGNHIIWHGVSPSRVTPLLCGKTIPEKKP